MTKPIPLDPIRVELQARALRAEYVREMFTRLKARLTGQPVPHGARA